MSVDRRLARHDCGEGCSCPEHPDLPMFWSAHSREHACQDITCKYGHGFESLWVDEALTQAERTVELYDDLTATMARLRETTRGLVRQARAFVEQMDDGEPVVLHSPAPVLLEQGPAGGEGPEVPDPPTEGGPPVSTPVQNRSVYTDWGIS